MTTDPQTTNIPKASDASHAQTSTLNQQGIARERDGNGMSNSQTTPLPKNWHRDRLKDAKAASRELMLWSLYLNGKRTIWERITGEFRWKNQ